MASAHDYPDDFLAASRMPFGEHIEELRRHLFRALAGVVVALIPALFLGNHVMEFMARPVEKELGKVYERRIERLTAEFQAGQEELARLNVPTAVPLGIRPGELADALKIPGNRSNEPVAVQVQVEPVPWSLALARPLRLLVRPPVLDTLTITEAFVIYFKVSLYCALILASPWVFYQIWSFIAAGLFPHEKRLVRVWLPLSLLLFLAGVGLCEFWVLPAAVEYLLSFNEWLGLEPNLRLSDWLSFAITMPLIFGAAFQTPLVMVVCQRAGVVSVATFRRKRRLAMFLLACLSVLLSAAPDAFSMLSLTIPLWALYELGILLCLFSPSAEESTAGELLEV